MKELTGNLWDARPEFIKCITTNGVVKKNGELVMGAGVALQAKERYPQLPSLLGSYVKTSGNIVYYFEKLNIASFPTKNDWKDKSDIRLIVGSCVQLSAMLKNFDKYAVLPRPGCSNGGLDWEKEVKPYISGVLSDRVWVITI
jgi:hypothetical protein